MLKSLYSAIDWESVAVVGFDMDGTLYDEADFIVQVYQPIAELVAAAGRRDVQATHQWLFRRWLEKGSSYPHIFAEALEREGVAAAAASDVIARCVAAYRQFAPALRLSARVTAILDAFAESFALFLVSDGSLGLQSRKFAALGLERWFARGNVAISGAYGPEYSKPSTRMLEAIDLAAAARTPQRVVFFGDRACDAGFAANAGFHFVPVRCMEALARSDAMP
jgi:FMN phosphatase YigB (HAD superfamily)